MELQKLKDDEIKSTIENIKTKFIDELKKICVDCGQDPRSVELLTIISNLNEAYLNIIGVKKFYADAFLEDSKAFEDRKEILSNAIKYYKTT